MKRLENRNGMERKLSHREMVNDLRGRTSETTRPGTKSISGRESLSQALAGGTGTPVECGTRELHGPLGQDWIRGPLGLR